MTLTVGRAPAAVPGLPDRRGRAVEPRRSWASPEPFVPRETIFNSMSARRVLWQHMGVRYALLAMLSDVVAAALVGAAVAVSAVPTSRTVVVALLAAPLFVAAVGLCRGYGRNVLGDGPTEFQALGRAAVTLGVVVMALAYFTRVDVPRHVVLLGIPGVVVLAGLQRYAMRLRLHRQRCSGTAMMGTIVVGDQKSAGRVVRDLSAAVHHGYRVDGVCLPSVDDADLVEGVPVVGAIADVVQVVADRAAEVVVVTGASVHGEALRRLSWALGRAGAHLVVAPDLVEVAGPRLSVRPTAGLSLLEVQVDQPRRKLIGKSLLDFAVSVLASIVALPIVLVSAVAIRLDSRGPAFYKQTRVGIDGSTFTIYKLRTMYVDADRRRSELQELSEGNDVLFKMRQDPRVTRVGRVLRRFSIDELPQLWNVVRGDMSIVGPRPPLESEVADYHDSVQRRLHVKPGLTGLWQVSGRSDLDWEESVRLDLRYVDNWSVAMDLMILWKTGRAVLAGTGAY
ncbi:polyprenyl glycosylphosphotransferase [Cellulomonas sp. A375-1]|nr:polyprenyl glycosylphosphotransferase [Cellulomonas sp. A375-1]